MRGTCKFRDPNIRTIYAPIGPYRLDISRKAGEEIIRFEYVEGGSALSKQLQAIPCLVMLPQARMLSINRRFGRKTPKPAAPLRFFLRKGDIYL